MSDFGNALSSGAQARYYTNQAQKIRDDENALNTARPFIAPALAGDQSALNKIGEVSPELLTKLAPAFARLDAREAAKVKGKAEFAAQASGAVLQANPADRPLIYKQILDHGRSLGYDVSTLPPEYSPAIDGQLRSYRAMAIPILKQFEEEEKMRRHTTPGARGGGGGLEPMGGAAPPTAPDRPPGPRAAAPGAPVVAQAAPSMPFASGPAVAQVPSEFLPAGYPIEQGDNPNNSPGMPSRPDIQLAQTAVPQGARPGASGPPAPPQVPRGPIVTEDPSRHGYVLAQDSRKPGQAVINDGYIHYIHPQTKAVVLYKPRTEKPEPAGPFSGNGLDAQAYNIVLKGDPSSPEFAAAYAHLAAERVVVGEDGRQTRIKPDMSWARQPVRPAGAGGAQQPTPGSKTVEVDQGRGKPLDSSARDDLTKVAGGALDMTELFKSFKPSFGGYMIDALGDSANFAKRNLPDSLGGADPEGQAQWWQRYQGMSNIERNKLFGAALTPGEAAAWKAATVTPGMKPDQIRENLARQNDIAQKALSRLANSMAISGYNKEAIEAATGVRIGDMPNPMGGVPQATPAGAKAQTDERRLSPEEAAKLSSGTAFIGQDGIPRVRK